jgi:hypothetical protein
MVNPIYGAAVDPAYVDYASAVALNVYSDQLIEFRDQGGTLYTQSRYRINGVLDTNSNVLQNVDSIMTACDSWMTYQETSGKWAVVVNKAEAASFAFDDSNIVGAITVGGMDITTSINQIEGRFPEGANRDQFNYVYIETPSGILYPNEPVNKTNVNYDLVNNNVQAYYLANRLLEQAREDLNVTINTTYVGIQVNAGDVVSITNSYYGWNAKLFRVMQVREASLPDGNLGAQIQMAEYSSAVYDNFDITQYAPIPNSDLVAGGYFSPLSAPTIFDAFPDAVVPNFDIRATVPASGRVTAVYLYYTTNATPTAEQWALLDAQVLSNSAVLLPNSTFDFDDISLPSGNYYFAFKVGNDIAQSDLSPSTAVFNWNPTGNAGTNAFVGSFAPSSVLVPFDGTTADFSAAVTNLNGVSTLGQVQYVTAATDADGSFVANTWRIGGSSTTGTGDIVKTNITIGNPSASGLSALFPVPTAMSSSSAKVAVPIRYKNGSNEVFQVATTSVQYVFATKGDPGIKTAAAYLYQWSTVAPSSPNGTSTYTWSTGINSAYTGGNGWSVTIPANPGTPNIYLWQADKELVVSGTTVTTTVDWTTGVGIAAVSLNGAAGTQSATPTVFQWAITIPASPTGTSTYTWSTGLFTPTPAGWSLTPPAIPSAGYTLWGATVPLLASATQTTSSINWTTASITARGYAGDDGATGTTGASARICYTKTTLGSLLSTPPTITTSGSTSFPPNGSWGTGTVWQATPPAIVAGESVYQSDGIYSPTTNETVWNVPYLSALKVGSLSAITANLGSVTAGNMTIGNTSTGLFVNNPSYPNAVYAFQNSQTIYGLNVKNAWASNNGGGAAQFTSNYGFTADFAILVNAANPNGALKNCAIAASGAAGGGQAFIGVTAANGAYAGYAQAGSWSPFTGSHDGLIAIGTDIDGGDIVIDSEIVVTKITDSLTIVTKSATPNQSGAIGIFVSQRPLLAGVPAAFMTDGVITDPAYVDTLAETYNNTVINGVGEGAVNVCGEGGDISIGDLIVTSSTAGKGMKQSDGIVRSYSVARARQAVTFANPTEVKLVACIYLCG